MDTKYFTLTNSAECVRVGGTAGAVIAASLRVVVGARPLEVHQVIRPQRERVRDEVILHARIRLHDIATLTADVHVVDFPAVCETSRNAVQVDRGSVCEATFDMKMYTQTMTIRTEVKIKT